MSDGLLTSYEEVPYESKPIYRTHPDSLATVAAIFGMKPPGIERCRVLELGCASGGNLIPMALTLPKSEFLGIDLSPRQIADGQQIVDALGLHNIQLKSMSLMDLEASFGAFDYIICHGVYSWVPPEVQDRILEICSRRLTPQGIAYVSYNTYPGWHLRGMIRDMMQYHAGSIADPRARVQQARAMLEFLVRAVGDSNTTYGQLVKEEVGLLNASTDSYLLHEQLEEFNRPVYFHEFMARAGAQGLQFVSETQFSPFDVNLPAQVRATLDEWTADFMGREQYLDFLRNRTFRRSLLCHAEVPLQREPLPEIVKDFHVAALGRPQSPQPDIYTDAVEEFRAPDGAHISTNHPQIKTMLVCLFENWPRPISFGALWEMVQGRLRQGPAPAAALDGDVELLAQAVLHCFLSNVVELHVQPPPFVLEIGERPVASSLARLQAAHEATRLTSLSHRIVELDLLDRLVVRYLDGEHDRAALLRILMDLAARDVLVLREGNQPLRDPDKLQAFLKPALETALRRITASALLLG